MTRNSGFLVFLLAFALTGIGFVSGCSDDSSSAATSATTNFKGFGSQWDVALAEDGTFVIQYAATVGGATVMTVNGTWQSISAISNTNLLQLEVTSASGTDAPAAGEKAYGILVPGFVFLLKPLDPDSEIIPMVVSGSCPSGSVNANWIVTSYNGTDNITTDADVAGTFAWDSSSSTPSLGAAYSADGGAATGWTAPTMTNGQCSSGNLTFDIPALSETINTFATSIGGLLVNVESAVAPADNKLIVAMPEATLTLADLEGTYDALVFDDNGVTTPTDKTAVAEVVINNVGVGNADLYSDVESGTLSGSGASLTFASANVPSNGFVTATVDNGVDPAGTMLCTVVPDANQTGKTIAFCAGGSLGGANSDLYNVLLVER